MEGLVTAFDTALKVVQTDAISMMSTALPVGLGIAGIGIAVIFHILPCSALFRL